MIAYVEGRLAQVWGQYRPGGSPRAAWLCRGLPAHTLASLPGRGEAVAFTPAWPCGKTRWSCSALPVLRSGRPLKCWCPFPRWARARRWAFLSIFRPDDLRRLVLEDDVLALTRVSGIGKKTAEHIFLELKYKLKVDDAPQAAALVGSGVRPGSVFRDVLDGLGNLGYSEDACAPMVKKILLEEPDLDVTGALRPRSRRWPRGRF